MTDFFNKNHYFNPQQKVFSTQDFSTIKNYFFDHVKKIPEPLRYLNCANDEKYKPAIGNLVTRSEILDIVKPILGEDLVFWSIGVCYKPAHSEYEVGWHIDSHCWMRDKVIFPPEALILFFSLTDMNSENGGLEIIPGLNEAKFYDHDQRDKSRFFFEYEIKENELRNKNKLLIEMKENQLCGFASHVPHRSGPNRSSQDRLGLTLRYLRSSVKITGTPLDGRDSFLVSGIDRAGNRYASLSSQTYIAGLSQVV